MKEFDKETDILSAFDFDSFAEEMDILFGDRFGAKNVVDNHIDLNIPKYSELMLTPVCIENEDEAKEANNLGRFISHNYKPGRFIN